MMICASFTLFLCVSRCLHMLCCTFLFFFFKQKTAYEMRISDWSSDVCSSDLPGHRAARLRRHRGGGEVPAARGGDRMSPISDLPGWAALLTALFVILGAGLTLLGSIGLLRPDNF